MHGFKSVLVSNHVNNMLYVFIDRNARVRIGSCALSVIQIVPPRLHLKLR